MKKILTWFVATLAFMTIFNCTDDRIINNGDSMLVVRTKINQNFSDLYDSVQHHTDLIQVIDYIGTQDSIDDHRTAINALVVADGAMDTRVDALELIDHTHSNSSILNATTASFTTTLKTLYDGYNTSIGNLDDSISDHRTDINLNVYNIDFLADFIRGDLADTIVDHRTDINYALNNLGGGTGTGDVKVDGTTTANTVAYWQGTDSTLVSNDVVKLYADSAVFTEEVKINDTLRLNYLAGGTSEWPWLTVNIYTAAVDTAHTENVAWRGLIMALEKPSIYFKDQKEVVDKNGVGHMELRIYYVDSKTKELKYQYGWGGLDVMETQSAYQIFHEISLRYIVEQEEQINKLESRIDKLEQNQNIKANLGLDIKFMIIFVVFLGILCFILAIKD